MKRLLCIAVALVMLVSCTHGNGGDPFSVFANDFEAEISSQIGNGICKYIYKSAEKSIIFTYPEEIAGIILIADGYGASLSFDGISIEVSQYAGRLVLICESVFSQKKDAISSISVSEGKAGTLTVVKTADYTYTFSGDGAPMSVSGIYDGMPFEMTLIEFAARGVQK